MKDGYGDGGGGNMKKVVGVIFVLCLLLGGVKVVTELKAEDLSFRLGFSFSHLIVPKIFVRPPSIALGDSVHVVGKTSFIAPLLLPYVGETDSIVHTQVVPRLRKLMIKRVNFLQEEEIKKEDEKRGIFSVFDEKVLENVVRIQISGKPNLEINLLFQPSILKNEENKNILKFLPTTFKQIGGKDMELPSPDIQNPSPASVQFDSSGFLDLTFSGKLLLEGGEDSYEVSVEEGTRGFFVIFLIYY